MKDEQKFGDDFLTIIKRASLIIITLSILTGCLAEEKQSELYQLKEIEQVNKETLPFLPAESYQLSIAAIGDLLIHSSVYNHARTNSGFDFMPMVSEIQDYLTSADVATANQETMIGGETFGLSTYPQFNSPHEVGDMVKELGIDIVTLANNHTLDRGEEVVYSALDYWDEIGVLYTGSYRDAADQAEIRVIEKNNISIAFLGYSYGTNGIPVPRGKDYLINLIDQEQMAQDVAEAKEISDVVVMHLHFGDEYIRMPNMFQQELVQYVVDLGVDIVFGHHPHVLQPVDWVKSASGEESFVIYSLGNFLSGQDQLYRQIGGIIELDIHKEVTSSSEKITLATPRFLPTYVDPNQGYKVIPLKDVTDQQLPDARQHYEEIKSHMSQWMPELDFFE